jgi:hypothetical protein
MIQDDNEQFTFGPWKAGLVNSVDEYSLPPDALSLAEDVNIDREGIVTTRNKWSLQDAEQYVSVFEYNNTTYAVRGTSTRSLGVVGESSFSVLDTVAGPVSWTLLNGDPVYTDGEVIRVIKDGVATELSDGYFMGDEEDEYQLVPMPGGSEIHYWQGRLLVARGNSLLWSEAMRYDKHSATRNFVQFSSKVIWVAPLVTGVYVGTRDNSYFLSGSDPAKFTKRIVGGESAPGVAAIYNPRHSKQVGEEVALWFTRDGIAVGNQEGAVDYPQASRLKELPLYPGKMVIVNDRVTIFTTKEH